MKTRTLTATLLMLALIAATAAAVDVRIKDIARFQGYSDNQLVGFGLVIGLNGTGDGNQIRFTSQMIANFLNSSGIRHDATQIRTRNAAAVMITATLPPFVRPGSKIDITVSAIGDATSLQGGTLVLSQLTAPNGEVYATAQGPIVVGGFAASGAGASVTQNVPTSGIISNGAIVQREVPVNLQARQAMRLVLNEFDFTTAARVCGAINEKFGREIARSNDAGSVDMIVPLEYQGKVVDFIAAVEGVNVQTDEKAVVVINERTGTVVIGKDVRISTVAIAHGNLTISVSTQYLVSQPQPFAREGETVVVPDTEVTAEEQTGKSDSAVLMLPEGTNIGEIVRALNALGVTPRDIIAILQAMKAQGALKADLKVI